MSRFQLREIQLDNYRCFEELKLPLEEDATILFAENGDGKTALLAALAMGIGVFQRGAPKTSQFSAARDIRLRTLDERGLPTVYQADSRVRFGGAFYRVRGRDHAALWTQMWVGLKATECPRCARNAFTSRTVSRGRQAASRLLRVCRA